MPTEEHKIQKKIADDHGKDVRIIKAISEYPFKFAKERMSDPRDDRPIRIRYFGVFAQKHIKNKDLINKHRKEVLLDNIEDVTVMMATTLDFVVPTFDSAKKIIEDAYENKDYDKIEFIWDGWRYYRHKL